MEKVYIIKIFDARTWNEYITICFKTEQEANDHCLEFTDFKKGIICSYQEIPVGSRLSETRSEIIEN